MTQQVSPLRQRMIDGCEREAAGRSVAELEKLRDDFLTELLPLVERFSVAPPGIRAETEQMAGQ